MSRFRGFGDVAGYAFLARDSAIFTGRLTIIYPNGTRRSIAKEEVISEHGLRYYVHGDTKILLIPEGVNPQTFAAQVSARTPTSALPASLLVAATTSGAMAIPAPTLPSTTLPSTTLPSTTLAPTSLVVTMKPLPPPPVVVKDTTYVAVSNSAPRVTPTIVPDLVAVNTPPPPSPKEMVEEARKKLVAEVAETAVPPAAEPAPPAATQATQADVPPSEQIVDVPAKPAAIQQAGVATPAIPMKWLMIGAAGIAVWIYFGPAINKALSASPRRSLNRYGSESDG